MERYLVTIAVILLVVVCTVLVVYPERAHNILNW
jgi:hypothetical protein